MHHVDVDGFIQHIGWMQDKINLNAKSKGFWHEGQDRNKGEMIALMHSELSEALEAIREKNPPDKHCQGFTALEVEMADTVIRIMDFCAGFNLKLAEAIVAKVKYNESREQMHGKTC